MVPALVALTLQSLPLIEDNQQFQVACGHCDEDSARADLRGARCLGLGCLGRGREELGGWREEKAVPCKSTLQIKSQDQEHSQLGQRPVGRSADTEISADEAEGWLLPCSRG